MNNELDLIRHLYDEDDAPGFQQKLAGDPVLQNEYRSFEVLRKELSSRPRPRPDRAVLEAVYAAAEVAAPPTPRRDRAPVAHRRVRLDRFRIAGTVSVFLVLISLGTWRLLDRPTSPTVARSPVASAESVPDSGANQTAADLALADVPRSAKLQATEPQTGLGQEVARISAERQNVAAATRIPEMAKQADSEPVEEWDAASDVTVIHSRIQQLEGNGRDWDQPILPAASSSSNRSLMPVASPSGQ